MLTRAKPIRSITDNRERGKSNRTACTPMQYTVIGQHQPVIAAVRWALMLTFSNWHKRQESVTTVSLQHVAVRHINTIHSHASGPVRLCLCTVLFIAKCPCRALSCNI